MTQLRLSNFKIFKNLKLDLAPITILTGANSSGKSSVLNAISAIGQTDLPLQFPFELAANGKNCSLGTYKDISRNGSTKENIHIGFCVDHNNNHVCLDSKYRFFPVGDHILPQSIEYRFSKDSFQLEWQGHEKGYRFRYEVPSFLELTKDKSFQAVIESLSKLTDATKVKNNNRKTANVSFKDLILGGKATPQKWISLGKFSPRELPSRIRRDPMVSHIIQNMLGFTREFRQYVSYVGPIRATPLRYYLPDKSFTSPDAAGAYCCQLLHDWQKYDKSKFDKVISLLNQLELVRLITSDLSNDEILKILVHPYKHFEQSNLADVGFGISQALPMVVADVALPKSGLLLLNQPEVHLHPTSQAKLANYFSSRCKERQYLIETHSEYLLNRMRILVSKKKLRKEDVVIYFFGTPKISNSSTPISRIGINPDGSLSNAPKEFFRTYYTDSFTLAMGA